MSVKYLYISCDYITEYLEHNGVIMPRTKERNGLHIL